MLLFPFSLHGKGFPPSLPLFPCMGGVAESNTAGSWLHWLDEGALSLWEKSWTPILILSCTKVPGEDLAVWFWGILKPGRALGLCCLLRMLPMGIREWKISSEEGALTS